MSVNSIAEAKNHRPKSPEEVALMASTQILKEVQRTLDAAICGMLLGALFAGFLVVGLVLKDKLQEKYRLG